MLMSKNVNNDVSKDSPISCSDRGKSKVGEEETWSGSIVRGKWDGIP